ncbi:MAG TPA: BON domain-containing protein [Chloroflexota bacterium]|nr:BON domain-containing protein [Chloroflexota bacterium]
MDQTMDTAITEPTPTDTGTTEAVRAALLDDEVLQRIDAATLRVEVSGGAVTLHGHVVSAAHRERAEAAMRRAVPGAPLHDELVADDELAVAIAQALARDGQTAPLVLRVQADEGVVHLSGQASTAAAAVAEEIAAGVPGVRAVVGHLPGDVGPDGPTRLPAIGTPVEATDGEVGRVEAVVVDPRFRRVTHLVVAGRVPVQSPGREPEEYPPATLRKLVPVALVDRETPAALFLRISVEEVLRLPAYRDDAFVAPPPAWRPPADYAPADVRFAVAPRNDGQRLA